MITIVTKGSFKRLNKWLHSKPSEKAMAALEKAGRLGVDALAAATPEESGETAASWGYVIEPGDGVTTLTWTNSHTNQGVNIAIILQYGHGTGTGGYVPGRDYINPALQPIFDSIAEELWKEVTSL